jgi:hypothetical protein
MTENQNEDSEKGKSNMEYFFESKGKMPPIGKAKVKSLFTQREELISDAMENKPIISKQSVDRLNQLCDVIANELKKDVVAIKPMVNRYKQAWVAVREKMPEWRKNEFDKSLKDGTFGVSRWDTEFSQAVIELAESESPLK